MQLEEGCEENTTCMFFGYYILVGGSALWRTPSIENMMDEDW
jgi:hypothetical protein